MVVNHVILSPKMRRSMSFMWWRKKLHQNIGKFIDECCVFVVCKQEKIEQLYEHCLLLSNGTVVDAIIAAELQLNFSHCYFRSNVIQKIILN